MFTARSYAYLRATAVNRLAAGSLPGLIRLPHPSCCLARLRSSLLLRYFETLSFLPPLSEQDIAKQVDYMVGNGWVPCLEFSDPEHAYVSSESTVRMGAVASNYVDNRYWTMFKLPMFGCNDASTSFLGCMQLDWQLY